MKIKYSGFSPTPRQSSVSCGISFQSKTEVEWFPKCSNDWNASSVSLKETKICLADQKGVFVLPFGSFPLGTYLKGSDLDITVVFTEEEKEDAGFVTKKLSE